MLGHDLIVDQNGKIGQAIRVGDKYDSFSLSDGAPIYSNPRGGMQIKTSDYACKVVVIVTCVLLSACGGNDITGTYTCESLGFVKSIELTPDGRIYTKAEVLGETQQTAGTYEVDGTKLIATVDGSTTVMGIDNGALVSGEGECVTADRERKLLGTYIIDMEALKKSALESATTDKDREKIREHMNNKETMVEISKSSITVNPDKRIALNLPDHHQETSYKRKGDMLIVADRNDRKGGNPSSRIKVTNEDTLMLYADGEEFPITFVRED